MYMSYFFCSYEQEQKMPLVNGTAEFTSWSIYVKYKWNKSKIVAVKASGGVEECEGENEISFFFFAETVNTL